jgi:hypothetical protein
MSGKSIRIILCVFVSFGFISCSISVANARSHFGYNELMDEFMTLVDEYPEIVSVENIGTTVENKNIIMFKIGNPNGVCVLFDGAIHGWETVSSEIFFYYARWLVTSEEPVAKSILENSYTLLIPVLNVDNYNDSRKNANGVDLNRNFATNWERAGSSDSYSEYYHGPEPISEPETQALLGVFEEYEPKFYANLHEGGTYYAGSTYGVSAFYEEIVEKVNDLGQELDVHPYYYMGEFRGGGMAISDAAVKGITSFIVELADPTVPYPDIETELFPRFRLIAVVLSQQVSTSIDLVSPVTQNNYNALWQSEEFTIFLSATDEQSGVAETYYTINGGPIRSVSEDGQPLIKKEGSDNVLEYWSVDVEGNEEGHKILTGIKLDKTAPLIEITSDISDSEVNPDQEVKIQVNASDSLSGLHRIYLTYSINDQSDWFYLPMTFDSTVGLYEESIPKQQGGTLVRFKIEAYDNAGNTEMNNINLEYSYSVIPEFTSLIILTLCLITSLFVIVVRKKLV